MNKRKKKSKMRNINKSTHIRLSFVLIIIIIIALAIASRLAYWQILKAEELERGALQQWTKSTDIKPERGVIYDRNGKKLAININGYSVWAYPERIEDAHQTAVTLAETLYLDEELVYEKLVSEKNNEKLKQWINREDADKIRKLGLKGIQLEEENKRFYPNGNFASHILGFTNIDNIGLEGVEKTFNDELQGVSGRWLKMADGKRQQMPYGGEKIHNATDGNSVVLTIDEQIQSFAEKAADKAMIENEAKNVSIIVMDPNTGDILAMVNKPDFNPNEPRQAQTEEQSREWSNLSEEELTARWYEQWRNFAVNDIYEPGSTFKLITAAAALEENKTNPNVMYRCTGAVTDIPGVILKCASKIPHGDIDFKRAMEQSCNVAFVNVGRQLGKESIYKYTKAFGFGEKTYIDLMGEELGLLPPSPDKMKEVNLATLSYGHGIATTPIQIANATSAIVNGGNLMKPQIIKEIVDLNGNVVKNIEPEIKRKVISQETSRTMLSLMESTVSIGSGKKAIVPGYRVGGKTGTAEKIVDGVYLKGKYIGSFVGVGPIENPQLVVLAIVDEPKWGQHYGGNSAAPIVKEILSDSFKYFNIKPTGSDIETEVLEHVDVPDLIGKPIEEAGRILRERGFRYSVKDLNEIENIIVESQYPEAWSTVPYGSIIDLKFKKSEMEDLQTMPDFIGSKKEQVIKLLESKEFNYKIEGTGDTVVSQYPDVGTNLKDVNEIIIKMNE